MVEFTLFGAVSLIVIVVLFMQAIGGAFFEAKKIHIIHETGLGILLGIFSGFLFLIFYEESIDKLSDFNNELFFYVLLPVIIFSGGYNLDKKRFFQNFLYITLYGILGTIICFAFVVVCTSYVNEWNLIRKWDDFDVPIKLNIYQILVFSATICATDAVAGLTMIKSDKYPKLFSILFGEGLVNDAVAIIIFLAVGDLAKSNGSELDYQWWTTFQLLGQFLADFIASVLIGAFVGLFTTWMFKTLRFLTQSCILETALILYMGYASFTACELFNLSGVISVLVTGIILAHYNFYNISPIGKISSQLTLSTLSFVCEAAIYVYLGVSLWTLKTTLVKPDKIWSWTFVLCELIITFTGRAFAMIIVSGFMILIKGRKNWRLSIYEMIIIWFAGLIRGSIAYALIQQLTSSGPGDADQIQLLKNTTLIMVIITTIVLGGLMPLVININMKRQQKSLQAGEVNYSTIRETLLGVKYFYYIQKQVNLPGEPEQSRKYRSQFQRLFRRIDDKYLKPFFIFNFLKRKQDIEKQKKLLKFSSQEVDPAQISKMTVMLNNMSNLQSSQQGGVDQGNPRLSKQSGYSSMRFVSDQDLASHPEKQPIMSKIMLRSSYQSKFMGQQNFVFDFDVPLYEQNISRIHSVEDGYDDEDDDHVSVDSSNVFDKSKKKNTDKQEISITSMTK